MIIKIANLSEGFHEYKFDENIENIGLTEPFFGNFFLNVKLAKIHNQIILNGDLKLNARFNCDRCAASYDSVINTGYKMVYLFGQHAQDNGSIDVTYMSADADKIDLTNDVHDYAVLAIPMKKLCKEDCKGLCYKCGKDLNESDCGCEKENFDERWKPLIENKKTNYK
ncbi:MAG TPA: DUF177 domain-containing protein [Ignavibacteriaceae bacterium]|nr:DUF177 domain-containing protein [Ignavibacteriaceae bacterium]